MYMATDVTFAQVLFKLLSPQEVAYHIPQKYSSYLLVL